MGNAKSFKDLLVGQKAHELVVEVYKTTKLFPSEEKFGLCFTDEACCCIYSSEHSRRFHKEKHKR